MFFGIVITLSCVIFVFHVCHVAQPTDGNSITQTSHWNTHCCIEKCCNWTAKELILFLEEVSMGLDRTTPLHSTGNSSKSKHQCFSCRANCNLYFWKNKIRGHDVVTVLGLRGFIEQKNGLWCVFSVAQHIFNADDGATAPPWNHRQQQHFSQCLSVWAWGRFTPGWPNVFRGDEKVQEHSVSLISSSALQSSSSVCVSPLGVWNRDLLTKFKIPRCTLEVKHYMCRVIEEEVKWRWGNKAWQAMCFTA